MGLNIQNSKSLAQFIIQNHFPVFPKLSDLGREEGPHFGNGLINRFHKCRRSENQAKIFKTFGPKRMHFLKKYKISFGEKTPINIETVSTPCVYTRLLALSHHVE